MSGHNKWAQIKHKKAITDSKKSKIFSKLVRYISVEARLAKGDVNAPGLRAAIEKAKKENPDKDPEIEVVPLNQWKDIIWPDGYPGRRSGARGKTSINESIVNREVLNCIIKRLINYNK